MESQIVYKEKSVVIHRDENGFGLRVSGQNPVFVDFVHENGAAWKAGVRQSDCIIKVNGTLVRSYDHQQVVHMIQNCSPFVNLTLYSPEMTRSNSPIVANHQIKASSQTNNNLSHGMRAGSCGSGLNTIINCSSSNNNISNNNNLIPNIHSPHQRLYQHSMSNNLNWLLDIGDDLFQDNQQEQPPQKLFSPDSIPVITTDTTPHQSSGVSKLISSGPSPLTSGHSRSDPTGKPKLRHNRSQVSTRDNPYYYYKTAPEKASDLSSVNCATASIFNNQSDQTITSSKPSSSGLSMVRSRSSSKMSTRSTIGGKYKARNLRSRLVEDLRSLSIVNIQANPSSLSTSPSSSDLSDCDDQDPGRIDCLSSFNTSSSSAGHNSSLGSNSGITKSKKTTHRLEIIRELVDTEKTHTERLKHLNDLLYKPIKAEGLIPAEQLRMVFSCHKTLFKIHKQIYKILSAAQQNTSGFNQEPLIGRALIEIFEGELGRRLEMAASIFCACQSTNTELLNRFTRKDTKAGEFLAQVASQQMLGRLGIKDLLASCFQRLTKYPLLLENLLKATPTGTCGIHSKSLSEGSIASSLTTADNQNQVQLTTSNASIPGEEPDNSDHDPETSRRSNNDEPSAVTLNDSSASNTTTTTTAGAIATTMTLEDEYGYERLCITRALHQSRQILVHVNDAVTHAVAQSKLKDIWKKIDKHYNHQLPVIDIETQQLLHEGTLTLRLAKKTFEVYVILLTQYLVILTRDSQDKYKLKYFNADGNQFSPIFIIDEHIATRDTATDENGFYLLCKRKKQERFYEFASKSPAERAKWKEMIHSAQQKNSLI